MEIFEGLDLRKEACNHVEVWDQYSRKNAVFQSNILRNVMKNAIDKLCEAENGGSLQGTIIH